MSERIPEFYPLGGQSVGDGFGHSSHSHPLGERVETSTDGEVVLIRDSKQNGEPDQVVLEFSVAAWRGLITAIKNNEL